MYVIVTCVLIGILTAFGARFIFVWRQNTRRADEAPFYGIGAALLSMATIVFIHDYFGFKDDFPIWICLALPFLTALIAAVAVGTGYASVYLVNATGRGIDQLGEGARVRWDAFWARRRNNDQATEQE